MITVYYTTEEGGYILSKTINNTYSEIVKRLLLCKKSESHAEIKTDGGAIKFHSIFFSNRKTYHVSGGKLVDRGLVYKSARQANIKQHIVKCRLSNC